MSVIRLRIDSIAAGGDGVGRHGGMVVFVPRTAAGDLARVAAEPQGRLMRGRLMEVLEPSPQRAHPPCMHYVVDRCGGCQLQHLEYPAQLAAKSAIIRDAITRIGKVECDAPAVEPADSPWRYRRKLTLALRRSADGSWIAGLHRFDAPSDVFPLEDCPITDQRVLRMWSAIMRQQHLLPDARKLRGAVRDLGEGFSFTLEGGRRWPPRAHAEFFSALSELAELWWVPEEAERKGRRARRLLHSRRPDEAGAAFVQVNPAVADRLKQWVLSLSAAMRPATAVDAYAGSGHFAAALASQGSSVTAIEFDSDAARIAASRLPAGSRVVAAPVERALSRALPAELVVLNPPRAGVAEEVTAVLEAAPRKPGAVIYVSCNPATLARDLRRLPTYRIRSLRGFDMFPQTAHVETVCELAPVAR